MGFWKARRPWYTSALQGKVENEKIKPLSKIDWRSYNHIYMMYMNLLP